MKHVMEMPIEGGEPVLVEVEDTREGPVRAGRDGTPGVISETLQAGLERIRPVAGAFVEKFRDLPGKPDEVALKFGVTVSGEAGLVIAHTSTGASFEVSMTWRSEPAD